MKYEALLRALRDIPSSDPDAPMRHEAAELIEHLKNLLLGNESAKLVGGE